MEISQEDFDQLFNALHIYNTSIDEDELEMAVEGFYEAYSRLRKYVD